ncbi:MAG: hypothetical protein OEW58_06695 [Gammaproteobacteria bacterium]|nr:hypothetical protein [Gammaproteobacteria bacterium]
MERWLRWCVALLIGAASAVCHAENLSGPRIGVTVLSSETLAFARSHDLYLSDTITQFGWQFERNFFTTNQGPQGITALVPLLGGADQGVLLPSVSWVTGLRMPSGYEYVIGPNVSISGIGMAFAMGKTYRVGEVNFPVNFSVATSNKGWRASILFGFNSVENARN